MSAQDCLSLEVAPGQPSVPAKLTALLAAWRSLPGEMQADFLEQIGARRITDQADFADCMPDDTGAAIGFYNDAAERVGWPKVQRLSDTRMRALKGRLRDSGGLEGWRIAVARAEASDFLCGRTARSWTAFGFDWLVKAANFTKVMEGNYDNRPGKSDRRAEPDTLPDILHVAGRSRPPPEPDWLRG